MQPNGQRATLGWAVDFAHLGFNSVLVFPWYKFLQVGSCIWGLPPRDGSRWHCLYVVSFRSSLPAYFYLFVILFLFLEFGGRAGCRGGICNVLNPPQVLFSGMYLLMLLFFWNNVVIWVLSMLHADIHTPLSLMWELLWGACIRSDRYIDLFVPIFWVCW